jgi:hypothetical protein
MNDDDNIRKRLQQQRLDTLAVNLQKIVGRYDESAAAGDPDCIVFACDVYDGFARAVAFHFVGERETMAALSAAKEADRLMFFVVAVGRPWALRTFGTERFPLASEPAPAGEILAAALSGDGVLCVRLSAETAQKIRDDELEELELVQLKREWDH